MSMLCNCFNQYRDGMLDPEQTIRYESHLAECNHCRNRLSLLNTMVHAIRNQDMPDLKYPPERIAARACEQSSSWDVLMLSWLKPLPAWSLAGLLFIVAFFWISPSFQQPESGNNYEDLMSSANQEGDAIAGLSDADFENWLEEGGAIQ